MSKRPNLETIVAVAVGVSMGLFMGQRSQEPTTDTAQVASETPALAQTTQPRSSGEEPTSQESAIDPADVDPAIIDWKGIRQRNIFDQSYDPMLLRLDLDYTPEEIAAFNQLHVLPFNPSVGDYECGRTVVYDEDNNQHFSYRCSSALERPPHPYEGLPVAQLIDLAETDAEAAVFVSRNSTDPVPIIDFAVRASALSAKPGPIMAVANEMAAANGRYNPNSSDLTTDQLAGYAGRVINRIILERVADVLGNPRANPQAQEKYLSDFTQTPEQVQPFSCSRPCSLFKVFVLKAHKQFNEQSRKFFPSL